MFTTWRRRPNDRPRQARTCRPVLELLEGRSVPSVTVPGAAFFNQSSTVAGPLSVGAFNPVPGLAQTFTLTGADASPTRVSATLNLQNTAAVDRQVIVTFSVDGTFSPQQAITLTPGSNQSHLFENDLLNLPAGSHTVEVWASTDGANLTFNSIPGQLVQSLRILSVNTIPGTGPGAIVLNQTATPTSAVNVGSFATVPGLSQTLTASGSDPLPTRLSASLNVRNADTVQHQVNVIFEVDGVFSPETAFVVGPDTNQNLAVESDVGPLENGPLPVGTHTVNVWASTDGPNVTFNSIPNQLVQSLRVLGFNPVPGAGPGVTALNTNAVATGSLNVGSFAAVPGLAQTFTVAGTDPVPTRLSASLNVQNTDVAQHQVNVIFDVDGTFSTQNAFVVGPGSNQNLLFEHDTLALSPGAHTVQVFASTDGPNVRYNSISGQLFQSLRVLEFSPHQEVSRLAVSAPAAATAGQTFGITVTALDPQGNPATAYTGTVHCASSDASAVLPADFTFTSADNGSHTFTGLVLNTPGSQSLSAADTANPGVSGNTLVLVNANTAATHLSVSAPAEADPGVPFSITVTALDVQDSTATGYTGTVHFTSTDPLAGLPADYTFQPADQGVHTFTGVTLATPGVQTVTATDTATASITGSDTMVVTPGPAATHFAIAAPSWSEVGVPFSVTVTALDANDNPVPAYTGTVRLASSDPLAGLPAEYTFTAADAGVHNFANAVTLQTNGNQSVTAADVANPTLTGSALVNVVGGPVYAVAQDEGGASEVKVYDARTGLVTYDFFPYGPFFGGGVRVAVGDVNGDGVQDIITGAAPGGGPDVKVLSGTDLSLIRGFFAFAQDFTGGVFVAAGDVNADGFADVIVGADAGGGPNVLVVSGKDFTPIYDFFPFATSFTGGIRVAAGDVNGDGFADLVCGAGPGGGPNVSIISGANGTTLLRSFFPYDFRFTGGVYVGSADVDADGLADVITGAGAGGGPNVTVISGANGNELLSFFPYAVDFDGGVRVGGLDVNGDGKADILTGAGTGGGPDVRIINALTAAQIEEFFAFDPTFTGGLFVNGSTGL